MDRGRSLSLAGKVALVTGGGTGIGRAISLALARAGADVAVAARTVGPLAAVAAEVEAVGRRSAAIVADVTRSAEADALIEETVTRLGQIDVLVNNAGIVRGRGQEPLWEVSDEDWQLGLATNLSTAFYCSRAVSRHMAERKQGRIVNLGSAAGERGFPNSYAYGCAKAGVMQLTRVLAVSLAQYGITVNCIALGIVRTYREPQYYDQIGKFSPMGRAGLPEEVGPLAVYLASDQARYVTGQVIRLDAGILANGYAPVHFRPNSGGVMGDV